MITPILRARRFSLIGNGTGGEAKALAQVLLFPPQTKLDDPPGSPPVSDA